METLARICQADRGSTTRDTVSSCGPHRRADQEKGIKWWEELTASGGEGMVVKPLEFVAKGQKGWYNLR